MKLSAPPEKKVAYPAYFGVLAAAGLQLVHFYAPAVRLPPVGLVVLLMTAAWTVVGHFAPHTHLTLVEPPKLTMRQVHDAAEEYGWTITKETPTARITASTIGPQPVPTATTTGTGTTTGAAS